MIKPKRFKAEDLQHPKGTYKAWNGDERKTGTRWNGDADFDDQGFHSRGVHTVEGTRPQSNCRERQAPVPAPPLSRSYRPTNPDLFDSGRPALRFEEGQKPKPI